PKTPLGPPVLLLRVWERGRGDLPPTTREIHAGYRVDADGPPAENLARPGRCVSRDRIQRAVGDPVSLGAHRPRSYLHQTPGVVCASLVLFLHEEHASDSRSAR